jgi:glycosyltransferase involved in cell wall biosynthesis
MKLVAIIPAYNEEKTIAQVIEATKKYVEEVIVIDDSSKDGTFKKAQEKGAKVYRHSINRGLGGALGTGIQAALLRGADIIVTLDADGQHDPNDIPNLVEPIIKNEAQIVIGSRLISKNGKMPIERKIANWIGNIVTFLLFGIRVSDSQSGLRCFDRETAKLLQIKTNGMEVSSEIIKEIRVHRLRLREIPIKPIYTPYSLSKGQGFITGLKTLFKLLFLKLTK